MLRNKISDTAATYPPPSKGVNLRTNEHDLTPAEARLMQNCELYGAVRIRRGSTRLTPASFGTFPGLGGHPFYYGGLSPLFKRLIAYTTKISVVSAGGLETVLSNTMTDGHDTYFTTWPITDKVYISNGIDSIRSYDGTTFSTIVTTTTTPNVAVVPRGPVVPISDRLLALSAFGVERTSPRSDSVWSSNSSWATLRPQRPGLFTALAPYTLRGVDQVSEGALAFQERAVYHISGTDFGADASSATASAAEDAAIKLIDPTIGTASPDSVVSVPGIGIFWFTADLNVFWLPAGSLTGQYIGTKIQSTGTTPGLESTNKAQLSKVWMVYFDHILMLGIPTGTHTYTDTQWWLDTRDLREGSKLGPVWYGPMTGQTLSKVWVENQQGANSVYGLEGDQSVGLYVYELRIPSRFTDAVGLADNAIAMSYQTYFKDFGSPSTEKYAQAAHFELGQFTGTATLDLVDLTGDIVTAIPIEIVAT